MSDTVKTALAEAITPEMIEAGALEFARYDPRFESDEEAAIRIYQAMVGARQARFVSLRQERAAVRRGQLVLCRAAPEPTP